MIHYALARWERGRPRPQCFSDVSVTPCFSWVMPKAFLNQLTVSTVSQRHSKPLKRLVPKLPPRTRLKPGVN